MPAISPSCSDKPADGSGVAVREELLHRRADAVAALGGDIRPGLPGVIVEHHRGGLRQFGQSRLHPAGARPTVPGHDQKPFGQWRQAVRVQHHRAQQRQRRDALRIMGHKTPQIRRTAAGKMRARDFEMVEQCGEAGLDLAGQPPALYRSR